MLNVLGINYYIIHYIGIHRIKIIYDCKILWNMLEVWVKKNVLHC